MCVFLLTIFVVWGHSPLSSNHPMAKAFVTFPYVLCKNHTGGYSTTISHCQFTDERAVRSAEGGGRAPVQGVNHVQLHPMPNAAAVSF